MAQVWKIEFVGFFVAIATVCCFETDSPLRVQRLLHMEEEMIDFSDFVINQEKRFHKTENVELLHSFGEYLKFLKKAKYANALSFNDTHAIERDPIAIFHLKKRLTDKWLPHFEMLRESEMVAESQVLQLKIDNIESVIKKECKPKHTIENILRLKEMYNIPVKAIIEGKIDPQLPSNPIHAEDIVEIADYVAERDCAKEALVWLEFAMAKVDQSSPMYIKMLSKKGRLLLHEGEMKQAMNIYEKLMKLEPNKRAHKSSYEYARMRINSTVTTEKEEPFNVSAPFWHYVCNGRYQPNPERLQNLQCYEREVEGHFAPLQIEELHHSPKVVMVRNLFNHHDVNDILHGYSKEVLSRLIGDTYATGVKTRSSPTRLARPYMTPLYDTICNVTFHDTQLKLMDSVTPITLSEEGPGGNADLHVVLYQPHIMPTKWHTLPIAHYQVFLSDVEHGGGLAFPNIRLLVQPEKGAAVFWAFKTRLGPVHPGFRKVVNCPPLIGTQWLAKATISHNFVYNRVDL